MPGFDNNTMYADNVDFRGVSPVVPQITTDGQLLIGSTATPHIKAGTLTSSGGTITITLGSGTINLESTSVPTTWTDVSGSVSASTNNGYFAIGTTTSTLPNAPSQGNIVKYIVDTSNILTIQATGTQTIRVGNTISAAAGTCVNTQIGDSLTLIYRASDSSWIADSVIGNWNIT